mmetsp:Transcript_14192/g.37734  ORF Transcript_14192/g.37734 Transcript_14192/m.37734 type:complete len:345 (+) Transcript_14192:1053-2087(+)
MDPAAGGDAIGHVHELVLLALGAEVLVEVSEGLLLHDLGVQRGDAVDLVAAEHREVAHADAFEGFLLEEGETPDLGAIPVHLLKLLHEAFVDLATDTQVPGEVLLHHIHWPLLQSLRHHRVVRVVARLAGEVPSLRPVQPLHVHEQSHHLQDGQRGVRVVHLDSDLLRQLGPLAVGLADELAQQVLQGRADEEVLLLQTQDLAGSLVIVRVQDSREVLCLAPVVHGLSIAELVEGLEIELFSRERTPEPEVVGVEGVEARDQVVVGHGLDDLSGDPASAPIAFLVAVLLALAPEADGVGHVGARDLPGHGLGQPVVGLLDLPTILDGLFEDAVAVADAVTPAWQ